MLRRFFTELPVLKFPAVYPDDVSDLRKMIIYRGGRTGTKETEYILKEWMENNLPLMNRDELIQFHQEVIDQETVELYQILLGQLPHGDLKYLKQLVKFVKDKLDN